MYDLHSYVSCDDDILLHQQLNVHASFCENFESYWHNDRISCTCSIGSEIDPSFDFFDLGEDLISYLDACDCMASFLFPFLSWSDIRTLEFPQVECHEVFGVLRLLFLPECILPIVYQIWATWFDHL